MVALIGREGLRAVCALPYIRSVVRSEVAKELKSIEKSIHGEGDPTALLMLPREGLPCTRILERIQEANAAESAEYDARLHRKLSRACSARSTELSCSWPAKVGVAKKWAGIYHAPVGELVDLQNKVWGIYNCSNTLYEGVFPSVRKYLASC